jgi:hypothetical protein
MAMLPVMLRRDRERWGMSVGEPDPDDIARLRLFDGLERALGA